MALLFYADGEDRKSWTAALSAEIPGLDLRFWPDIGDPDDIEFALVWQPPRAMLATLPNLRAILSLGAGVEHILRDPELPRNVPIARLIDPGLRIGMVEFILMEVLRYHRREPEYRAQAARKEWKLLRQTLPANRKIGFLGLGHLGGACAAEFVRLGFDVAGWSRTRKELPGIQCHSGEDGMFAVLERSEILVNLLPLTEDTRDILDATTLGALPKGAVLINAARGAHLVDEDLIDALDSGHLSYASLDVYRTEPLPEDHPFWAHPKITVYPHAAAWTLPEAAAPVLADNIRRARAGEPLFGLIDRRRGY